MLSVIFTTLNVALSGIHESCQCNKHRSPDSPDQLLAIACVMFQPANDPCRYHVAYIGENAHDLGAIRDAITEIYTAKFGIDLQWTSKKGTCYFVSNQLY